MSCQITVDNDSCCNTQMSFRKRSVPIHRRSTSPQGGASSEDHSGHNRRQYNERYDRDFSYSTNTRAHAVCAICLGTHVHNVYACETSKTWDGQHATFIKRDKNELRLRESNTPICIDWQRTRGCPSNKHDSRHVCSGCGQASHRACACPRVQKA